MDSKTIQKLNNLEDTIEQAKLESLGTKGLVSLLDDTLEKIYCDEDLEEKDFSQLSESQILSLAYGLHTEYQKLHAISLALFRSIERLYEGLKRKKIISEKMRSFDNE